MNESASNKNLKEVTCLGSAIEALLIRNIIPIFMPGDLFQFQKRFLKLIPLERSDTFEDLIGIVDKNISDLKVAMEEKKNPKFEMLDSRKSTSIEKIFQFYLKIKRYLYAYLVLLRVCKVL